MCYVDGVGRHGWSWSKGQAGETFYNEKILVKACQDSVAVLNRPDK